MDKVRSTTVVFGIVFTLTVFKVTLVVSQENTASLQGNNYKRVPCGFVNGLCGWTYLNPDAPWTRTNDCKEYYRWPWSGCKRDDHYLRLQMDQLEENQNGTLISPPLVARTNVRCQLSFQYYYGSDNDACQLSVEQQTHRGVYTLWRVTTYSGTVEPASVDVPCSDTDYKILIVGKKLATTGCHHLDVENIEFKLSTLPITTEGATFLSLPRRVFFTSFTSLETTTASSSTPDSMPNSDKQSSDDDGLGTGPVVAIVIVIVIVVVVVVIVVIVVRRRNGAEKHNRASGPAGSSTPGNSNVGGVEGHDNLVYSANGLEMDTIPTMTRNVAYTDNTPDYYNVSGANSSATGPSEPSQDNLYENTRTAPPTEEYAVVDKKGKKKKDLQPEDEYALPNKDQQKKKKRQKQAGQGQQKNAIPTENKKKKGRKTDHQANKSALISNAAGRSTQAEEAAAAGTSDYEPVAGDSGMASSRPEQPSDMYHKLGNKERAGMQQDSPQKHYDHISAPDGDYSGMDLEDKIRDQQREAVADQYSHI
ncbi:uncharacterized protein [Littorina saxatilis]|uniref:uncharacterized protein n=1 Tax=Littorina saxatilis TaxID=31220 RepID=UPI0038B6A321